MKYTNKLDFSLTLKRFKMMGTSISLFRSISLSITVIPLLSFLTIVFCMYVFDGHPKETYTVDIELTPVWENQSPRGYHWINWVDTDGNLYSGEQIWLFKINDQVARKEYFENGKQTLVEIFNEQEKLVFTGLSEFIEDENGVRYLKHFQQMESSEQFLAFEAKWDQNIHTVKEYFTSGQLKYEFSFNTEVNKYEGLAFLYDENGNLLKQERYENGILIETIK